MIKSTALKRKCFVIILWIERVTNGRHSTIVHWLDGVRAGVDGKLNQRGNFSINRIELLRKIPSSYLNIPEMSWLFHFISSFSHFSFKWMETIYYINSCRKSADLTNLTSYQKKKTQFLFKFYIYYATKKSVTVTKKNPKCFNIN